MNKIESLEQKIAEISAQLAKLKSKKQNDDNPVKSLTDLGFNYQNIWDSTYWIKEIDDNFKFWISTNYEEEYCWGVADEAECENFWESIYYESLEECINNYLENKDKFQKTKIRIVYEKEMLIYQPDIKMYVENMIGGMDIDDPELQWKEVTEMT